MSANQRDRVSDVGPPADQTGLDDGLKSDSSTSDPLQADLATTTQTDLPLDESVLTVSPETGLDTPNDDDLDTPKDDLDTPKDAGLDTPDLSVESEILADSAVDLSNEIESNSVEGDKMHPLEPALKG